MAWYRHRIDEVELSAEHNPIGSSERFAGKTKGDDAITKSILPHETLAIRDVSSLQSKVLVGKDGRYELIKEIGRGGYGVVYLAYDAQLSRQVAIKIARPEWLQTRKVSNDSGKNHVRLRC